MSTTGFSHWTPEMVAKHNARFAPNPPKIDTAVSLLAEARAMELKKKSQRLDQPKAADLGPRKDGEVRLTFPYPPSANRYWRSVVINGSVRVLVSSEARLYKRRCATIAAATCKAPLSGPLSIVLNVYRPMKRGDLSNRIKVIEDAMQGVVFHDDDQIVQIEARRFDDKHNPRVEITIKQTP